MSTIGLIRLTVYGCVFFSSFFSFSLRAPKSLNRNVENRIEDMFWDAILNTAVPSTRVAQACSSSEKLELYFRARAAL